MPRGGHVLTGAVDQVFAWRVNSARGNAFVCGSLALNVVSALRMHSSVLCSSRALKHLWSMCAPRFV